MSVKAAEAAETGTVPELNHKPVFKPSRDFYLAFIALCTLALAVAFDATSLSVALPTISTALGGTALEAFWSGTSFLLSSTVLQPSIASLSNIFGRKYVRHQPPNFALSSPWACRSIHDLMADSLADDLRLDRSFCRRILNRRTRRQFHGSHRGSNNSRRRWWRAYRSHGGTSRRLGTRGMKCVFPRSTNADLKSPAPRSS